MLQRSLIVGLILAISGPAGAASGGGGLADMGREDPTADTEVLQSRVDRDFTDSFRYDGTKGLILDPPRNPTSLWVGLRFQYRFDSFEGDLVTPEDLRESVGDDTQMNRSRLKGGGTLFADWFEVYSEYDFPSETWLDYRATLTSGGRFGFRAGQWKSEFSRERIISSGKQQLADRSLANYWFTIDRQRGFATSARFAEGSRADSRLWVEYLSGHGRDAGFESGDGLLLTRLQWHPNGEQLAFSSSDLKRRASPVSAIAAAVVVGDSPFTRFSSSGGGSLPGFEKGDYELRQYLLETALHYRGLGWQQELHWKRIRNQQTGEITKLLGGYAQLGSFLNEWWRPLPPQLELVGRIAVVDPDRSQSSDTQFEYTVGANWFIEGHRHKLTADYTWLRFDDPESSDASQGRFRLQWELSL